MVNVNLLKSEIVKQGYTMCAFCQEIKMSQSTFVRRMKKGVFKTDEVSKIIDVLKLETPEGIFFAP